MDCLSQLPGRTGLVLLHNTTWVDEGFVANMRGRDDLDIQVYNPITELVISSHEEAFFFEIQDMGDIKPGPAFIVVES